MYNITCKSSWQIEQPLRWFCWKTFKKMKEFKKHVVVVYEFYSTYLQKREQHYYVYTDSWQSYFSFLDSHSFIAQAF